MGLMNYTYRDVTCRLKKLGYVLSRQAKGSHEVWKNEALGKTVLVPSHGSKTITPGVMRNIINDIGSTVKEFHDL